MKHPPIRLAELIADVALHAYPTAQVSFTPACSSLCSDSPPLFQAPAFGGALPPLIDQFVPRPGSRWEALHRRGRTGGPYACPTVFCSAATTRTAPSSGEWFPLGMPHAVLLVGGYERRDLTRHVLPALSSAIPSMRETPRSKRSATVRECRKLPSYLVQSRRSAQREWQDRGCHYLGGDVLQLSLPFALPHSGSASHVEERRHAYLTVGNPEVNLQQLLREKTSAKRNLLRSVCGYSTVLLKEALPPCVIAATRMIRAWEKSHCASSSSAQSSEGVSGSAFLVSAVLHALQSTSPSYFKVEVATSLLEVLQGSGQYTEPLLVAVQLIEGFYEPTSSQPDASAVSAVLAFATVYMLLQSRKVDGAGEQRRCWETNFFLPCEHFEQLEDLQVWESRAAHPDQYLHSCARYLFP